jgi:DNA processing protein
MDLSPEDRAALALRLAPGIGPKTCAALVARFGSARQALEASVDELVTIPYMKRAIAESLRNVWQNSDVDAELALLTEHEAHILVRGSAAYPASLAPLAGSPALLYVRGEIRPEDATAVAIVGSRACTPYGRRTAHRIAVDLAKAGVTVVSGLARGIDAEAHRGALEAGGRTIAVLANGLSHVYPPEHADLAEEVVRSGALLSEACMKMEPLAGMFPERNRIITGISRGVVVIEAGDRSGALHSARHAGEQGREVFVVPGPVDSIASAGSLQLLRDGARLVRSARDVLEDLEGVVAGSENKSTASATRAEPSPIEPTPAKPTPPRPTPRLEGLSAKVWELLVEPIAVDDLCRRTGEPMPSLANTMMMLELDGLIQRRPGNIYERS